VSAEEVAQGKPAPDILIAACALLGTTTQDSVLIGDSEFDRQSAETAEVFFVGFKMNGDVRIDTLAELAEICLAHKVSV